MFKFICTAVLLTTTSFSVYCDNQEKCIQQSSCLCVKNEYSKLDISSILGNIEHLEDTLGDITYYFLGCKDKPFTKGNCSVTSSLVKYNTTNSNCTAIGKASSIKFESTNNEYKNYELVYNESGNVVTSYPTIRLICDEFETPFIKIISDKNDELALSSPKTCFVTEHHGLSGGSIFLVILFITSGIYFFGGALLLYFIRGARGVEVIPNLDFWKNVPGLVKDGTIFLFSGCKPTFVSTAETYDRI